MNKKKQALLSALYRNIYHSKINLISNFDSTKAMRLQVTDSTYYGISIFLFFYRVRSTLDYKEF